MFLLLRRRVGVPVAFIVSALLLWFPPFRTWSSFPLTDSMGVAALIACLFTGVRAQSGPWLRVPSWAATVLLLALTRDAAAIPALAAVGFATAERSRRAVAVAAAGLIAAPRFRSCSALHCAPRWPSRSAATSSQPTTADRTSLTNTRSTPPDCSAPTFHSTRARSCSFCC